MLVPVLRARAGSSRRSHRLAFKITKTSRLRILQHAVGHPWVGDVRHQALILLEVHPTVTPALHIGQRPTSAASSAGLGGR